MCSARSFRLCLFSRKCEVQNLPAMVVHIVATSKRTEMTVHPSHFNAGRLVHARHHHPTACTSKSLLYPLPEDTNATANTCNTPQASITVESRGERSNKRCRFPWGAMQEHRVHPQVGEASSGQARKLHQGHGSVSRARQDRKGQKCRGSPSKANEVSSREYSVHTV